MNDKKNIILRAVDSLENLPASVLVKGTIFILPDGEAFEFIPGNELGSGISDIFRSIGIIAGQAGPQIAQTIPGLSNTAANALGTVAAVATGLFLTPQTGGPFRGLAAIRQGCSQLQAALDNVQQQAANGVIDRATAYAQADQLVALLSDPTAFYQAQRGDDAAELQTCKTLAAQKAAQVKAAADARAGQSTTTPGGTVVTTPGTTQPGTLQIGGLDTNSLILIAAVGLGAFLLLR